MCEQHPLHLGILDVVAALVLHNLLGGGVDEADEDVLLLSYAVCVEQLQLVLDSIVGVLSLPDILLQGKQTKIKFSFSVCFPDSFPK